MSRLLKEDAAVIGQAYEKILSEALYGGGQEEGKIPGYPKGAAAMPWQVGEAERTSGPYDLDDLKELFSGQYAEKGRVINMKEESPEDQQAFIQWLLDKSAKFCRAFIAAEGELRDGITTIPHRRISWYDPKSLGHSVTFDELAIELGAYLTTLKLEVNGQKVEIVRGGMSHGKLTKTLGHNISATAREIGGGPAMYLAMQILSILTTQKVLVDIPEPESNIESKPKTTTKITTPQPVEGVPRFKFD